MKAIIFARVSSKDQEDGQSIPAQVRRLTEYALKKNLVIDQTFQITESSSKDTRKQFDAIVTYLKKSKDPYALVTDTVDRLQRSFRETPLLDELRRQGKLELHFLRENLIINQHSNSSQLLQWDIGVLFASSYVRQLGDNVKRSQDECIRNGQWIFLAPYGYKNITLPSGNKTIEVDPIQAPIVEQIFNLYIKGNESYSTIATKMRLLTLAKTDRGKSFSKRTIELILKNPFYVGLMYIKEQTYPHQYERIISEDLFYAVQNIINKRRAAPVQPAGKQILLRGLIQCKNCNGTITGDIKKERYVYYSCHNSKRLCKKKWVREEKILDAIRSPLNDLQLSKDQIADIVDFINTNELCQQQAYIQTIDTLRKRSVLLQDRISKLIDMHIDGAIDSDTYHLKLNEYKQEQQRITVEIKFYEDTTKNEAASAKDILEIASQAKNIFDSSSFDEKQQFLKFIYSNLTLDGENIDLEMREPFNMLENRHDGYTWRS